MYKYILFGAIVVFIILIIAVLVGLISANSKVKKAFMNIDIQYKKKWELIPFVVDVVKQYASLEKGTIESSIKLFNSVQEYKELKDDDRLKLSKEVNDCIKRLIVLADSYDSMKNSEKYNVVCEQLKQLEIDINITKIEYNAIVEKYNKLIKLFPFNLFAFIFGFRKKELLLEEDM